MRFWIVFLLAVLWSGTLPAQTGPPQRFTPVADRLVAAINARDYEGIQQDFAQVMRDALPTEKLQPFLDNLASQLGKIQKLDPPRVTPPNQAVFLAHFERGKLDMKLVLDQQDRIVGLWFQPPKPQLPVPERNTTALSLPFSGEWFVLWGGDTREQNYHRDFNNQRFAFDFVIMDDSGKSYKSDGRSNEDYYAYSKEVLAPADGVVTEAIDGVRDNTPGSMNPYSGLGNAVFIQHSEHEISVLAHFQQGSVRVRAGDVVKRGQVLGLCGNSGNSSEPHLHYHLQNTPIIQDGTGIKCFFQNVKIRKDDTAESRAEYSPVKGDRVRQD